MPLLKLWHMQVDINNKKPTESIPYKFRLGEQVIFINLQNGTVEKGQVYAVSAYHDQANNAVNYTLATPNGAVGNVPETVMFRSRDEVLDWAIQVTQNV